MDFLYKDRITLATFAGSISAIIANLILYMINLVIPGQNINMPELTIEIFINIENYTLLLKILGVIWSTIIGGTYAIIYIIALDLTGWKHLWLKSLAIVSGAWLLGAGPAIKLMGLAQGIRDEPLSVIAFYIAHLCFATVLYLFVKSFGKPNS